MHGPARPFHGALTKYYTFLVDKVKGKRRIFFFYSMVKNIEEFFFLQNVKNREVLITT